METLNFFLVVEGPRNEGLSNDGGVEGVPSPSGVLKSLKGVWKRGSVAA